MKEARRREEDLGSQKLKITPRGGDFWWPKAGTENWPRTEGLVRADEDRLARS